MYTEVVTGNERAQSYGRIFYFSRAEIIAPDRPQSKPVSPPFCLVSTHGRSLKGAQARRKYLQRQQQHENDEDYESCRRAAQVIIYFRSWYTSFVEFVCYGFNIVSKTFFRYKYDIQFSIVLVRILEIWKCRCGKSMFLITLLFLKSKTRKIHALEAVNLDTCFCSHEKRISEQMSHAIVPYACTFITFVFPELIEHHRNDFWLCRDIRFSCEQKQVFKVHSFQSMIFLFLILK